MNKEILNKSQIVIFILLVVVVFGIWFLCRSDVREIRNVVLISIDTCRADYLSCYGYKQKTTPNIDAIAQEGVLFENTISPIAMTLPAHSSMMTGTIPPYHGIHDNDGYILAKSNVTLAEILKEKGFTTGATIGAFVLDSQFGIAQGFDSYYDNFDEDINTSGIAERRGAEVSKYTMQWLEENSKDPFFLFVHYFDPHSRYVPPEPFASAYTSNPYAGEIAYVDSCIGQVIDKLKKLGLYESTLLIITSDHGESLGEHGEQSHGYFVYQSTVKVPLIIKVPGGPEGKRVIDITGLIDILPTVCSLKGIQLPSEVQGKDLSSYIFGKKIFAKKRSYYTESLFPTKYNANSLLSLVTQQWKYIQTTRPELYDLVKDPKERKNLVKSQPQTARRLQNDLQQILKQTIRQQDDTNNKIMDEQTLRRLESLGYITGSDVKEDFEFDQSKDDPKDVIAFHIYINKISPLVLKKKYDEAKHLCKQLILQRPGAAEPYYQMGTVLIHEKNYEQAASYLHKAIEFEQDPIKALNNLGIALAAMGKPAEAIDYYQQALKIEPGIVETCYNLGSTFKNMGKFDEAIDYFQRALKLNPDMVEAHNNLGIVLGKTGKLKQAAEHYQQALKIDSENVAAHYNLGKILESQDNIDEAVSHLRQALKAKPDNATIRLEIGVLLTGQGEYDRAIKHFNESLRIKPDWPKAHYELGSAYYLQGRTDLAITHWTETVRLKPDFIKALNNLAWVLAVCRDANIYNPTAAVKFALKTCELTQYSNLDSLDTLAVAYAAAGDFPKAIEIAEKALQLAVDNEKLISEMQERIELYKANKPYYDK